MSMKIRNKRNGRMAVVTDVLGSALIKMGKHERADMQAIVPSEPVEPESAQKAPTKSKGRAKGEYERRDMQAK